MSSTSTTIAAIVELFHHNPNAEFHPSLFTFGNITYRSGMPHALRKLKADGKIEVACMNIEGKPIYRATDNLRAEIAASKH